MAEDPDPAGTLPGCGARQAGTAQGRRARRGYPRWRPASRGPAVTDGDTPTWKLLRGLRAYRTA